MAGALMFVAALWLAFPARSALARSETRRLEGQWLRAQALDAGRLTVMARLSAFVAPGDAGRVAAGDAALYGEEVARLRTVDGQLHADLLVDRSLFKLRAAMDLAVADQRTDLDHVRAWYSSAPAPFGLPPPERSPATLAAIIRASKALDAQRHRFGLAPHRLPVPLPFRAADPVLAAMGRIMSVPTRTRLIVSTLSGLLLVDIDANRVTPARLVGIPSPLHAFVVLARRTYVALGDERGNVYSVPLDLQGQARSLGAASQVMPAFDPDGVWLLRPDGTAVEVDGEGKVLVGPVVLPPGSSLRATVKAGLVLVGQDPRTSTPTIVWDARTRRTVRTVTADSASAVMAAAGDSVVWVPGAGSSSHQVHITTVSTGQDRQVVAGPNMEPTGNPWSISLDGTKIASTWHDPTSTNDTLGVIDVASGRLDLAAITQGGPRPTIVDWANSGDRVFTADTFGSGFDVGTYQFGSTAVDTLRLHLTATILTIALLSPDRPSG